VITTGFYTFTLQHAESEWRIAKLFIGMDNAESSPATSAMTE
jgi:hypothetical protein